MFRSQIQGREIDALLLARTICCVEPLAIYGLNPRRKLTHEGNHAFHNESKFGNFPHE